MPMFSLLFFRIHFDTTYLIQAIAATRAKTPPATGKNKVFWIIPSRKAPRKTVRAPPQVIPATGMGNKTPRLCPTMTALTTSKYRNTMAVSDPTATKIGSRYV